MGYKENQQATHAAAPFLNSWTIQWTIQRHSERFMPCRSHRGPGLWFPRISQWETWSNTHFFQKMTYMTMTCYYHYSSISLSYFIYKHITQLYRTASLGMLKARTREGPAKTGMPQIFVHQERWRKDPAIFFWIDLRKMVVYHSWWWYSH